MLLTIGADLMLPELGYTPTPLQIAANATMLQGFANIDHVDGSYWSLTYELGFYLLMLVCFGSKILKIPAWLAIFWCVAALSFEAFKTILPGNIHFLLVTHQYGHLFAAGLAFYWLYTRANMKSLHDQLLVGVILAAPIIQFARDGIVGMLAVAVAILLIFAAVRGALGLFTNRYTIWLGGISYPLYLIHEHVGWHCLAILHQLGIHWLVALLASILFAVLLAGILTTYIERPALRSIRTSYKRYSENRHSVARQEIS